MDDAKEVRQIPIEDIIPNRFQPRINFDEKALNELSESIKQHGIIQPLVLRPLGDKFEIIAGERRYKAASLAGLSSVPAIVTEMDDDASAEVALIENVQRKDLTSIEEAKSYKNMLDRGNMTQEELAKKMGLSQSTIANKLRLLNLSDEVQKALMEEKISERHARSLLSISDKEEQVKWLNRIINERLTVRQLDLAIKDELNEKKTSDGDLPIVNIEPDVESIINNAVDINPAVPRVEPATQIASQPESVTSVQEELEKEETPKVSGKFFNYLEDEEVNMSMEEKPKDEPKQEVPQQDVFAFTPEYSNAPENIMPTQQPEEEIETLDDIPVSQPTENIVVESQNNEPVGNDEPIFDINKAPEPEVVATSDNSSEKPLIDAIDEITQSEPAPVIESAPQQEIKQDIIQEPATSTTNDSEFIFDDEDESVEATPRQSFEPIPIVEGEGVVDPVAYFDTLEPDFMDKVKEYVGLDLKTAINKYRDLTNELNSNGFVINIDEADMDGKYHIEIDINKE